MNDLNPTASTSTIPSDFASLLQTVTDPSWLAQAALAISTPSPSSSSSSPPPDARLINTAIDKAWTATSSWIVPLDGDAGGEEAVDVELKERLGARKELARRRRRLATWFEFEGETPLGESSSKEEEEEFPLDLDDDPWANNSDDDEEEEEEEEKEAQVDPPSSSSPSSPRSPLPFNLPTFLTAPIFHLALLLTTPSQLPNLHVLVRNHSASLLPHRLTLLEAIPDWIPPDQFHRLLPRCDDTSGLEASWAAELEPAVVFTAEEKEEPVEKEEENELNSTTSRPFPLPSNLVSDWYRTRIESIESKSGLVDISLAYVQHAASLGVPSLDSLGEDLSLLSRLVYDSRTLAASSSSSSLPLPPPKPLDDDTWTLARWRTASPEEATKAYLRHATPETIVPLIQTLLLPYLFVLLSRSERTDSPDPTIPARLIQYWLLDEGTPLELVAEVFGKSKATLLENERILKKDEEVARLALAILYGNRQTNRWDEMSRVFECLPAWSFGPEDHEDGEGATTLLALAQFLRPTPTSPPPPPSSLYTFFHPLGAPSLSLLLDSLDVHLESAETLSRWGVPAPLGWFILSAQDRSEQFAWATRMARRGGERAEANQTAAKGKVVVEGWEALLRDMKKLRGGSGGDDGVAGAFGLLEEVEVVKLFFGGLLSSGNFALAKTMLYARPPPLDRPTMESLVLSASVEFYENAETGNLHEGEMKLAYACLSVVTPPTPALKREQAFIEATSKITSYNLLSSSNNPLSPLEIRLSKDRLSLVSQVLSASDDAYKHPEVILDLVDKLGFDKDEGAKVKALGMCSDAAVQSGDWEKGVEFVERMVEIVGGFEKSKRRKLAAAVGGGAGAAHSRSISSSSSSVQGGTSKEDQAASMEEAIEVCWKTAFQLGRQTEFDDVERKMALVGHALNFCPSDSISDLLVAWKKVEEDASKPRSSTAHTSSQHSLGHGSPFGNSSSNGQPTTAEQHARDRKRDMAARAAARTFSSLSSSLSSFRPLAVSSSSSASVPRSASPAGSSSFRSETGGGEGGGTRRSFEGAGPSVASLFGSVQQGEEEIMNHGRRALTRGVGWLLGASETEMGGDVI
ncbi:secretory pathway protein Sec39-domain-containing protein [Mrakia frigida]|uniref:secretory pathway protein Sec39-domain-containing protein n=1 Tax=Mrakia frigida TaxID=29902 RepID=UPI003FCC00B3